MTRPDAGGLGGWRVAFLAAAVLAAVYLLSCGPLGSPVGPPPGYERNTGNLFTGAPGHEDPAFGPWR